MSPPKITISLNVDDKAAADIWNQLYEYNKKLVGDDLHTPVRLSVVVDKMLIGGLLGSTHWGYLHIDTLIIQESYRGRGLGTTLLKKAEDVALSRGCKHASLESHDFQMVHFYLRNGYTIIGELPDLPAGHSKYIFHKTIGKTVES